MVDVKLSKETLLRIREPWSKALVVKVFGRTVGYNYLTYKINALWKPAAKLDSVHLGRDFFLIRLNCVNDYDKLLKRGSLVGSQRDLHDPIEGDSAKPVLHIDSYTASGTKESYARLCVQVYLERPLINVVRIGKCRQAVLYEGISALCFSCGRLVHTQGKCCYSIKPCEKGGKVGEAFKAQDVGQPGDVSKVQDVGQESQPNPNYRPWMLVTRKRNLV
ncbi:uncharacterized protein LOC142629265 [Castanea sativa]|uniref:uncharacterized protein LOC142629265 n=1 Tax=Castanea sativa TaxID=21020 RepID=UPI003F6533C0